MIPIAGVLLTPDEAAMIVGALDLLAAQLRESQRAPTPKLLDITDKLRRATATASRTARNSPTCAGGQPIPPDSGDYAVIGTADAARILGISPNGVRDLARRGVLRGSERAAGRWLHQASAVIARSEHAAPQRN